MFIEERLAMLKPMSVENHPSDFRKEIVMLKSVGCVFVGKKGTGDCERYISENEHKYSRGYDVVRVVDRLGA